MNTDLESRWKKYKFRQFLKKGLLFTVFVLFCAIVVAYMSYKTMNISQIPPKKKPIVIEQSNLEQNKTKLQDVQKKPKELLSLTPSLGFEENLLPVKPLPKPKEQKPQLPEKPKEQKQKPQLSEKPKEQEQKEETFSMKSQEVDLDGLIEAFKIDASYSKACLIAEEFLAKKNYKKAVQWSIRANEIDARKDRSWVVFAKAKIALGEKQVAKKAIDQYLQKYSSQDLLDLLELVK